VQTGKIESYDSGMSKLLRNLDPVVANPVLEFPMREMPGTGRGTLGSVPGLQYLDIRIHTDNDSNGADAVGYVRSNPVVPVSDWLIELPQGPPLTAGDEAGKPGLIQGGPAAPGCKGGIA
jgi:hypothetical protein